MEKTTMLINLKNVEWLNRIKEKLRLNSYDAALDKVRKMFTKNKLHLDLE